MEFKVKGLNNPDSEHMVAFRDRWLELIARENRYLSGQDAPVSGVQAITVYIYTGKQIPRNEVGELPTQVLGVLPVQMELEAVFRARSMALAEVFAQDNASV